MAAVGTSSVVSFVVAMNRGDVVELVVDLVDVHLVVDLVDVDLDVDLVDVHLDVDLVDVDLPTVFLFFGLWLYHDCTEPKFKITSGKKNTARK